MGLSGRLVLCAVVGLSVVASACGDSGDDSKGEGSTAGEGSTDGDNSKDAGQIMIGDNNGGDNTGGSTGADGGCSGPGGQCTCSDGAMGFQACTNGMLGECTCSIDLSDAGLPPVSECAAGSTCQSTMGFIKGVAGFCPPPAEDGGAVGPGPGFAIPPMCATKMDCETAGLPNAGCVKLMLPGLGAQQLCVQPCTPAAAPAPTP